MGTTRTKLKKKTSTKLSPFVIIEDISFAKKNLVEADPDLMSSFKEFLSTRHFSYFQETLFIANELNLCSALNKKEKYDFLFYGITPRKRFQRWSKKSDDDNVKLIQRYYDYNYKTALQVLKFFIEDDLKYIERYFFEGGLK